MRKSKSYEVRNPMNIWNKYDFAMSGLGKKSKILAKIKHLFQICLNNISMTCGIEILENLKPKV